MLVLEGRADAMLVRGALVAASLLLSVGVGVWVVYGNRRRYVRKRPDLRGFASVFIGGSAIGLGVAWLVGEHGLLFLGSMELFIVIISLGTFVWPATPSD
jgi:hypothetical protein